MAIWPLAPFYWIWPHDVVLLWLQDLGIVVAEAVAFTWICELANRYCQGRRAVLLAGIGLVLLLANPWTWWGICSTSTRKPSHCRSPSSWRGTSPTAGVARGPCCSIFAAGAPIIIYAIRASALAPHWPAAGHDSLDRVDAGRGARDRASSSPFTPTLEVWDNDADKLLIRRIIASRAIRVDHAPATPANFQRALSGLRVLFRRVSFLSQYMLEVHISSARSTSRSMCTASSRKPHPRPWFRQVFAALVQHEVVGRLEVRIWSRGREVEHVPRVAPRPPDQRLSRASALGSRYGHNTDPEHSQGPCAWSLGPQQRPPNDLQVTLRAELIHSSDPVSGRRRHGAGAATARRGADDHATSSAT